MKHLKVVQKAVTSLDAEERWWKMMKKYKVREYSPAWFLVNGGGIGLAMIAAFYGVVCWIVTLANNGVL